MDWIENLKETNLFKKKCIKDDKQCTLLYNILSNQEYCTLKTILLSHIRQHGDVDIISPVKYCHTSIGWHPYFVPHWNFDLTFHDFFNNLMMSKIRSIYDWTSNLEIKRIYCSMQTSEQPGNWHYDDDDDTAFTFCMYCSITLNDFFKYNLREGKSTNNIYDYINSIKLLEEENEENEENEEIINKINNDDDGYFHIKFPNEPIRFLKTENNCGILFDSRLMHLGDCPKHNSKKVRCVIAFKLTLKTELKK
jgi:hypothetical protein